jgi:hypothetical protein
MLHTSGALCLLIDRIDISRSVCSSDSLALLMVTGKRRLLVT